MKHRPSASEAELREAMSTWCRGNRYWSCLVEDAVRVDLQGNEAGRVTHDDAARPPPEGSSSRQQGRGQAARARRSSRRQSSRPRPPPSRNRQTWKRKPTQRRRSSSKRPETRIRTAPLHTARPSAGTSPAVNDRQTDLPRPRQVRIAHRCSPCRSPIPPRTDHATGRRKFADRCCTRVVSTLSFAYERYACPEYSNASFN